ncbi:alpha/beta hydrolase [Gordonia shandongensis]|uniref:alpha/beta hydrolase n=1 Tax=Gordonia shandongensis TaxID=376351 RepID=UPI00146D3309|nr:alpha/beta hydrolase [Gordonia shandongensis]
MRVDVVVNPTVRSPERTILHIHGGGFVFGSTRTHRLLASELSKACRARVVLFDYRLMPEYSVSSAIADCMRAYEWAEATYPDHPLVVSGDSAGGNLMLSVLKRLVSAGRTLPMAAVGLSAWLDPDYVHEKGAPRDSFFSLRFADRAASLANPRDEILPLQSISALPPVPVLLQCGAEEPVLTSNRTLVDSLVELGTRAVLQAWEGQPHVFQMLAPFTPESVSALANVDEFLSSLDMSVSRNRPRKNLN